LGNQHPRVRETGLRFNDYGISLKWLMTGKSFIPVDGEQLRQLYVVDGLTSREIAERLGIGFKTVLRRLQSFGIEARPPGPDRHEQLRDSAWLRDQYESQRKSTTQIAAEIGASPRVVNGWLWQHGITPRSAGSEPGRTFDAVVRARMSAAKKGAYQGESNPNWRGGLVNPNTRLRVSYASKAWSLAVRNRDGQCVECGAGGKLHAHHIKSWKQHPELRFDVANGVTLCPPCHQKAHGWKFPAWAYHGEPARTPGAPMKGDEIV
jgi:HNH endonuclease